MCWWRPLPLRNFNPRSREGSDKLLRIFQTHLIQFQSTLPRRERQEWQGKVYSIDGFQSTLPRRERLCETDKRSIGLKFQSTLPRRERQQKRSRILTIQKFQSTLPRRERLSSADIETVHKHFNPRSREGSDKHGRSVNPN